MDVRPLDRDEIGRIWTEIDRSEVHHHVYRVSDGVPVLTPGSYDLGGWPPDQAATDLPKLRACFDRGGALLGAFEAERLVGVAVVDTVALGRNRDRLQLVYLYVSRPWRGRGVGGRLFEEAASVARARGASFLYVSATPSRATVEFYLGRGCRVAADPDPALLAAEPDDVHLVCAL